MKAFAAHNWSRELQWQIPLTTQYSCNECSFPHMAKWDDGWKTWLDVQNGKIHCRNLFASGCQWQLPLWPVPDCLMGNSKRWAQDTLGICMRKPSVKGTRNLAGELERIFQREETERKCIVRRQWQGQSWMDRAPSTDTGEEGATGAPWAKPRPAKFRDPLKGQTLPSGCASERGGGRKQLCPPLLSPVTSLGSLQSWKATLAMENTRWRDKGCLSTGSVAKPSPVKEHSP